MFNRLDTWIMISCIVIMWLVSLYIAHDIGWGRGWKERHTIAMREMQLLKD